MRVKSAERPDIPEGAALPPGERSSHGFAVVFEQIKAVFIAKRAHLIERGRISQNADRHYHAGFGCQCAFELADVHIERLQVDVHKSKFQPVLLERMKSGCPRNRRNDNLISAFQRGFVFVEQGRNADEIGRRSRIDHYGMTATELSLELFLETPDVLSHGEHSAADD